MSKTTYIYRIIHYKNLDFIIKNGIHCCNSSVQNSKYLSIGDKSLITSRGTKSIQIEPKGVLNDYIPFYFGVHSPMLYRIHTGRVDGINYSQNEIIYLVSSVDEIIKNKLQFVFTDRHAYQSYAGFYNKIDDLKQLDWDVIHSKNWKNVESDNDRMSRKQAEFLVYKFLPENCIIGIGVYDEISLEKVKKILKNNNSSINAKIKRNWYY